MRGGESRSFLLQQRRTSLGLWHRGLVLLAAVALNLLRPVQHTKEAGCVVACCATVQGQLGTAFLETFHQHRCDPLIAARTLVAPQ